MAPGASRASTGSEGPDGTSSGAGTGSAGRSCVAHGAGAPPGRVAGGASAYHWEAGPEAANNASAAGTLVPLLTLGLPTSATAAIMLAGFQQFGLQPGPLLFATNPQLVWGLIASLLIANTVTGAASLFRREVGELALPFPQPPGTQYHDHWVALVAMACGEIAYVDRPLYDYVQHGDAAVDLAAAAAVLRSWDRRYDLESVGAPLWREFMASFTADQQRGAGPLFAVDFDPDAPVVTPDVLAPAPDGDDHIDVVELPDLDAAARVGRDWAQPDGVVLLSPAAPSFDRFRDYRHRAETFAAAGSTAPGTSRRSPGG